MFRVKVIITRIADILAVHGFERNKIKKLLKNNRGSGYIDTVVIVIIVCMLLMLCVTFMPIFVRKSTMGDVAKYISRMIAIEGKYDSEVKQKVTEYLNKNNFNDMTIDLAGTEYISGTEKIQLSNTIIVTVQSEYDISFWNFKVIPISLSNKATERSEVYWKN